MFVLATKTCSIWYGFLSQCVQRNYATFIDLEFLFCSGVDIQVNATFEEYYDENVVEEGLKNSTLLKVLHCQIN